MMMIIVQVIKNVIMAGVTVAIMAVTTMEVMAATTADIMAVTTVEVMAATTADIMAVTTMEGITMVTTVADITAVVKNVIAAKDVTAAGAGFFNTRALKQQKELKKLSSFFCKLKLINGILRIYSKCILEEEKNV
nr:hypothetical protein [Priestia aryabhattai]MDH3127076.1 hypothetical protein [Priestia aryabhattai]